MAALPPILVELKANAGEFMTKMGEARHEVSKLGTESAGHMQKFAAFGKAALFGVAGAATVVGVASLELADRFEKANARLEGAIANVHGNFDALRPAIDATNDRLAHFGFTSDDVESSLASLVNATKNPAKSLGEMGLAADIAKGRNISLEAATQLLVKVQTGHVALLGRLGIATKDANGKTISQTEAISRLSQMYGGDAARSAETFAGKTAALKAEVENLGTKIGLALIPVIEGAVTVTMDIVNWFEKHKTIAEALGIVVGGVLVVAIGAYIVSMATAAVATIAATWPILAIIAAIALVVVGVMEFVRHWHTIWADVSSFVTSHVHLIAIALAVLGGPIGLVLAAALELGTHWHTVWGGIQSATSAAWSVLKPIFGFIVKVGIGQVRLEILAFERVWAATWSVIETVVTSTWDVLRPIFDAISKGIGGIGKGISFVEGAAGKVGGVAHSLHIPGFAVGTDYAPGGLARVGENGPELVNLPRGSKVYPHGTGPSGGGGDVHVHIDGPVYGADADELALKVRNALLRYKVRNGAVGLA